MSGRARQSGKTLIQIRKRRGRLGATHGYWPGRKVSTQLLAHLIPVRSCTRVRGSVGIPNPRESGSVIGADRRRSGPPCVLPKGVPQGQTESGGIVLAAICWATSAQGRCHQEEAFCLPTFSHLLIVNKLLSLSLSHGGWYSEESAGIRQRLVSELCSFSNHFTVLCKSFLSSQTTQSSQ